MKRLSDAAKVAGTIIMAMLLFGGSLSVADEELTILDMQSFWRAHVTLREPRFGTPENADTREATVRELMRSSYLKPWSPAPAAHWMQPEFDDSAWYRARGHTLEINVPKRGAPFVAVLCVRGRFKVTDPERVSRLSLSATFRGGMVVYLNGKEVARSHLPEGTIGLETLAAAYPREATFSSAKEGAELGLRHRFLQDVALPLSLLRKGTNVLALEIHPAPSHPDLLTGGSSYDERKTFGKQFWSTSGLLQVELKASGKGVVANVSRPRGLQIWNAASTEAVYDVDFGDANEKLRPISLVGARKGTFCGQVVVSSDKAIKGLKATVTGLRHKSGKGRIPPSEIKVLYALPGGGEKGISAKYPELKGVSRFDVLAEAPPAEVPVRAKKLEEGTFVFGAVQPVWIKVAVPADAAVGGYEGKLTIHVDGAAAIEVPIALQVSDFTLPDPRDYRSFVDLIQSPDTVALQYQVPLWSDEHFKLMEKSFALMGSIGCQVLYLPLIARTNLGNEQSMVRWIKQPEGSYEYDFSILERYLDLAQKYLKPRLVIAYVWEVYNSGKRFPNVANAGSIQMALLGPLVTVVNPADGETDVMEGPLYTDPDIKAFWEPVARKLRQVMKARGLDKALTIGLGCDVGPFPEAVQLWKDFFPESGWAFQGHTTIRGWMCYDIAPVVYQAPTWVGGARDPIFGRTYGWQNPHVYAQFHRNLNFDLPLTEHRQIVEWNIQTERRGLGRIGADFWPVIKGRRGAAGISGNRYPLSTWFQVNIWTRVLAPGPEGALSTVRFELMREGVQQCEARIAIEQALTDEALRARLSETSAKELEQMMNTRTRALLWGYSNYLVDASSAPQEWSAELFNAAARVVKKLGGDLKVANPN